MRARPKISNGQDAVHKEKFIMEKVREEGFLVVERQTMRFTRRLAERFYEQHRNKASHVTYTMSK